MKLRYIYLEDGPMAHPPRLGVQGVLHTMVNGSHMCDTDFELWVDNDFRNNPDHWVVYAIFLAPRPKEEFHGCTCVVFGNDQRGPFKDFETAFAFMYPFAAELYDKPVEDRWMNATVVKRGIEAWQYLVPNTALAGIPHDPPYDEVDESEGGNTDATQQVTVEVDVPPGRILH